MAAIQPLTIAQFAAIAGLSVRRLQQLEASSELVSRTPSGGYDPAAVGGWLRARIAADYGITQDGRVYNFEAERARKAFHDADLAEMEAAEKRGDLIPAADVQREWTDVLARIRGKLLSLPTKLAARTASPDRLTAVEAEARRIVHEALTEMSEGAEPAE
jgi:phage terminase Nu1 subunit (DNA packaging protein)